MTANTHRGAGGDRGKPRRAAGRARVRGGKEPVRRRRSQTVETQGAQRRPAEPSPAGERLQKVLAAAGVASRRVAEQMIAAGRVAVDGRVVTTLGTRVDTATARIEVDGKRIAADPRRRYLAMNKPPGYVSTTSDERGRPTVVQLLRSHERIYPVGRLDADTTGLLLLTNDGELAHRLMHPRYGIERTYFAEVSGSVAPGELRLLTGGISLEDGPARAVRVRIRSRSKARTQLEIVLAEGRKREVRRMLEAVGHPVRRLVRTAFGPILLGNLPQGETRSLRPEEVGELQRMVGL